MEVSNTNESTVRRRTMASDDEVRYSDGDRTLLLIHN
jgi:hypothetical protein